MTGVNPGRDFTAEYVDIREVREGEICRWERVLNLHVGSKSMHFQTPIFYFSASIGQCLESKKTVVQFRSSWSCYGIGVQPSSFNRYGATYTSLSIRLQKGVPLRLRCSKNWRHLMAFWFQSILGWSKPLTDRIEEALNKGYSLGGWPGNERAGVKFSSDLIGHP